MQADLIADIAAEEFPDRDLKVFAFDIPERDIDGGDGPHNHGASEWGHAVQVLPVVFDAQR